MIENPENSLSNVTGTANATSAFVYDGDGNRVKSTINTTTTAFIGNHTEWDVASSSLTRYYFAGSTRVAMRKNNAVYYLLSDHLGSTSLTTDQNGQNPVKQYYLPWGEVRYTDGNLQTKYTYTGQYSNVGEFGLMYYNARYYDPLLSRFSSADTIVPQPGNPLDWDRYSYVHNSPTNKADPSGHMPIQGCGDEGKSACTPTQQEIQNWEIFQYESGEIGCQECSLIEQLSPDGRKDSFVFAFGFPSSLYARNRDGMKIPTTIYWGLSIVNDNKGGIQLYSETLDIEFTPRLEPLPGEQANPSDLLGAGVSFTKGLIWQEDFITEDYLGEATSWGGSLDIVTVDYYESFPENKLRGLDIGFSAGFPVSGWRISTFARPITIRIDLTFWSKDY
jgi:RHS repeat-associated protein